MATIGEMLTELASVKQDIKTSLAGKGQVVGNDFTTYAEAVDDIQTGEAKPSRTLIIISAGEPNISEMYETGCEEPGSILNRYEYSFSADPYTTLMRGDAEHHSEDIGDFEQYQYWDATNQEWVNCNSIQDGLDHLYGANTTLYTELEGITLYNYINTLQATYSLTLVEWGKQIDEFDYTYGCEEPGCTDYYAEGYGVGYGDYPDYGTTPNPEYADDCNGTWMSGYDEGFNAAQSEAEGGGDEPEPEPEEQ